MKTARSLLLTLAALAIFGCGAAARAQDGHKNAKTPSQALLANWNDIGNRIIAMAEDWPEDKYTYRPNAQVRTFQQVLLHVCRIELRFAESCFGNEDGRRTQRSRSERLQNERADGCFPEKIGCGRRRGNPERRRFRACLHIWTTGPDT